MSDQKISVKLVANSEAFTRAMRRAGVSMRKMGFAMQMFNARIKPRHQRHGAIKHARDMRRAQMKRDARA